MNMDRSRTEQRSSHSSRDPQRKAAVQDSKNAASQGKSYQGRFLTRDSRKPAQRRRKKRKQSNGRLLVLLMGVCSLVLLVLSLILIIHSCTSRNPVVGSWKLDSMTTYEFYDDGKGALIVPKGNYSFTYTLDDDKLSIDFHDENALDSEFVYEVEDDVLTMVGGNKAIKETYVLQKQDS